MESDPGAGLSIVCILPDGQRITAFSILRILAQTEMQPPLVLRSESAAAGNFLHLLLAVPIQSHLRADRAAIARRAFQRKLDPLFSGVTVFL